MHRRDRCPHLPDNLSPTEKPYSGNVPFRGTAYFFISFSSIAYRIFEPTGRLSSGKITLTSPLGISAAQIMPQLSTPHSFAGFRFATRTIFLPIRSSGLYHGAMPETTCLPPMPSSSWSFSSFLDFFTFSHSSTFATRRSVLPKVSMSISSASGWGVNSGSCGSSLGCAARISCSVRRSPFPRRYAGR